MYFEPASVVAVAFVPAEKAVTMTTAERVAMKILVQLFIGEPPSQGIVIYSINIDVSKMEIFSLQPGFGEFFPSLR
jgi:hypothetical protein